MNRSQFLKQSLSAGALALLPPLPSFLFAQQPGNGAGWGEAIMKKLVAANDAQVEKLLQTDAEGRDFNRRLAHDINLLTASYCCEASRYHRNGKALATVQKLAQQLTAAQTPDGTVNVGNLESPPDTAFIAEIVTAAATVLRAENAEDVAPLKQHLKTFLTKAGDALTTGGVHTPNHRWVISAALARINALYPAKKYVDRINDWLSEGIFINADGNYAERSRIYSLVENTAYLAMARLLNKPTLLEPVRKNLQTTYYYTEPNGDLVTNDSRRQDQYTFIRPDANVSPSLLNYYLLYRYMAIKDADRTLAAVAGMIEGLKSFEEAVLNRSLISFLEEPLLQKPLPPPAALPTDYEKLFAGSHLLRIRRGKRSATLFGGVDWPLTVASGRSASPDFFAYRNGAAVLKYLRLSTSFFSTGYFYSEGLKKTGSGYVLHKKLSVPYYQPLPKARRKANGDYALSESIDGRFWNKMDFPHRPVSNVKTLDTTITFNETAGRTELSFDINGQAGVNVTLELCFAKEGKLSGVSAADNGNYFLEDGYGRYEAGNDVVEFGPGVMKHKSIANLEGERYSTHFGSLRSEGLHVYLTGITPFRHTLRFR